MSWPVASSSRALLPQLACIGARATVLAVERFYTTVEQIRERATEGRRDSTLSEGDAILMNRKAAPSLLPVSRRGVAGNRRARYSVKRGLRACPALSASTGCSHPACPDGLRRFQD